MRERTGRSAGGLWEQNMFFDWVGSGESGNNSGEERAEGSLKVVGDTRIEMKCNEVQQRVLCLKFTLTLFFCEH